MQFSLLITLATASVVLAAAIPKAVADIEIPRSPAPNVVLHDYGRREAVADIEIPRSPAPNVVLHDYGKRVADIEIPRSPAPNVVLHDYGK